MPMVEGIGDEVIQVLGLLLIVLIFITAWKSTAIGEIPQIRAVFILDRRSATVINNDASAERTPAEPPDSGQTSTNSVSDNNVQDNDVNNSSGAKPNSSQSEVNALRLSYFSNLQSQGPSTSTTDDAPQPSVQNDEQTCESETGDSTDADSIRVKLKYLNDDQRIVRGNLKELLGEFKRRYFEMELSNNKSVLLIFQGRVLREEETLETIGMYDNCVVHCLVKSGTAPNTEGSRATSNNSNSTPADWNLGPILLATLVAMFALAWFSYWTYPQLFGITSTILLGCLTTIFILAVASLYYPQLFQSL